MYKECIGCKKSFSTNFNQKKYCSKKCRESFRGEERMCEFCKKTFIGRPTRIFCSTSCFGKFHSSALVLRNLRNRKYPNIDGLSRQQIYWKYNPEARKKDLRRDVEKREVLIKYLGNKCVRCGFDSNIRALELDHKNNDGDKDRKKIGTKIARYYIKNLKEASEKLRVLCANCNKIKAFEEQEYYKNKRTKFLPFVTNKESI